MYWCAGASICLFMFMLFVYFVAWCVCAVCCVFSALVLAGAVLTPAAESTLALLPLCIPLPRSSC